ncbi:MAG: hypothetical protein HXN16_00175 [Porphyromonas sp.]|uniref:hypothetical protein n=1 Tax=Porphyromonas sp. TaxID=1924944 RepID=UPI001CAE0844|nr:hypothetical protein [Porphyromonas sp.]MBF1389160.1 hypothetical protein [Porphyromonas sp.]
MNLLPALVVGLTATFLAVQDSKSEKKEPEEKAVETPVEVQETPEEKEKQMDEYEEIVNDEYLNITMEDDLSEIMGEDEDEEVAEGESISEITEDDYNIGIFNFDQVDLMYFTEDRILCDGDMVTIDNVDEWLGNVDLETQSDEITVKWIRNFNLPYDIRLEIIGDAYSGSL